MPPPVLTNRYRGTPAKDRTSTDTKVATINSDNDHEAFPQPFAPSIIPLQSSITPRNGNSGGAPSSTIGIVLGSIFGFLVLLAIIYVCYFRHHSTMYIVSRSSSASSKASQKRRRRRKPIIAGLPRPREVIIVDVVRMRDVPSAAPVASAEPPADAPAEAPAAEG